MSTSTGPTPNVSSTNEAIQEALAKGYSGVSAKTYAREEYSMETDPTQSPRPGRIRQADYDELRAPAPTPTPPPA